MPTPGGTLLLVAVALAAALDSGPAPAQGTKALEPPPANLPGWVSNTKKNHIFYKRGRYNHDVYRIPKLARDLNAVAVGHAMAYEDLVTGNAARLETHTFARINRV